MKLKEKKPATRKKKPDRKAGKREKRSHPLSDSHSTNAGEFAKHIRWAEPHFQEAKKAGFRQGRLKRLLVKLHQKGSKRFTIMLIPHTEKKILNWHVSVYTLFILGLTLSLTMILSVISLINKSGEDIEFYDIGLGDRQFSAQTIQIAEELIPLHELINKYTSTVAEMYLKLSGDKFKAKSLRPETRLAMDAEIAKLNTLVQKCQSTQGDCSQKDVEDILRKAIHLSYQDNHSIRKAIELSESIFETLDTKEKRNLLKNTPNIWPTQGYLLTPYGSQVDPLRGRKVFKRGIEIGALPGTEVSATAPGEVVDIAYDQDYGLKVHIKHRYGIATFYAQLDRVRIQIGSKVDKGEVIGYVGQSGNVAIPMLYYEVHIGTVAYDPYAFINHLQDPWLVPPKI